MSLITFVLLSTLNILNVQASQHPYVIENELEFKKMKNGFTYYIKSIPDDSKKIYLKLLVKAGILHQDADQPNIAHFLEHMASKGSTHFSEGVNDQSLERNGVLKNGFSASLENVQYNLIVPTGDKKAFKLALLFYKDIITGLKLRKEDIDNERGVLQQEIIYRTGDQFKNRAIQSKLNNALFPCRLDSENSFEKIQNFPRERLDRYYNDWYRSDIMTLIVAGDLEGYDSIEETIQEMFSNIPAAESPRKLKPCDSLYFNQPDKHVILRRENDSLVKYQDDAVELQMFYRDPKTIELMSSLEGLKRKYMWQAVTKTLNRRFKEKSEKYLVSYDLLARYSYKSHPSAFSLKVDAKGGQEFIALRQGFNTIRELSRYGFSSEEWETIKNEFLENFREKDLNHAKFWMDQILNHEIYGEPLSSGELTKVMNWLKGLDTSEASDFISALIPHNPNDIGIIVPQDRPLTAFTERSFRRKIQQAYETPIRKYEPPKVQAEIMDEKELKKLKHVDYKPQGSGYFNEQIIQLQNGVKVILKNFTPAADRNEDRILIHGFKPVGASSFPEKDYFSAINAPHIIRNTGAGKFDKFALDRLLRETSFWQGVIPYIESEETGIRGSSELKDIEKVLQLIYLYFKLPKKNEIAFKDWQQEQTKIFKSGKFRSIGSDFQDAVSMYRGDKSEPLKGYLAFEGLQQTKLDRAYAIYGKLFSDVEGFTFIMSGDFDPNKIIPLVRRYLGNLPVSGQHRVDSEKVAKKQLSVAKVYHEFEVPYPNRSSLYKIIFSPSSLERYSWKEEIKLKLLGVLTDKKIKNLRYEHNLSIYNAQSYGKFNDINDRFNLHVFVDCTPQEFKAVKSLCNSIFSDFKKGNFDAELISSSKTGLAKDYKDELFRRNSEMQTRLYKAYRFGNTPPKPEEALKFIDHLSKEDLIQTANKYFKPNYRYEFVWKANID